MESVHIRYEYHNGNATIIITTEDTQIRRSGNWEQVDAFKLLDSVVGVDLARVIDSQFMCHSQYCHELESETLLAVENTYFVN